MATTPAHKGRAFQTFQVLENGMHDGGMQLSPRDMVVSLKLALQPGLTFQKLADGLGLSVSAVHRSVTRAKVAGLLLADRQPNRSALRGGRARERNLAKEHLTRLLDG